jgi:aspartate/tyrosine/aromatic aminotransferase
MWREELATISGRIIEMRQLLRSHLERLETLGDWSHITTQIGMFSFTGLTAAQSENMVNKWHVYMLKNGRISMSGLNTKNCEYVAQAIKDSVTNF